jgi:hypothetical protein
VYEYRYCRKKWIRNAKSKAIVCSSGDGQVNVWLWILGILLLLFLIVLCTSIRVELKYNHQREGNRGSIIFFVFGKLIRYQIKIPEITLNEEEQELHIKSVTKTKEDDKTFTKEEIKKYLQLSRQLARQIEHFYRILRQFLQRVTFEKLHWETSIGTGDAAETGVVTGILWGIKMGLISTVGSFFHWKRQPMIQIHPHFSRLVFETRFHSIIRFRIGHAILAIHRMLLQIFSNRRDLKWPNIQSKG